MKKRLLNSLLLSVLMMVGITTVWAAAKAKYTPALTAETAVEGYAVKAYYDLSTVDANGICPTEDSLDVRYREGWGIYNYGNGQNANGTVAVSVSAGDLVLVEYKDTQYREVTVNEISNCTKNDELSNGEIVAFDVDADATSLDINMGRRVCVVAILVLQKNLAYTVNEVAGGKVVRATEGVASPGEIKVPYRRYNVVDGKLYQKGVTNKEYNYSFTLTTDGQEENLEYSATDIENVVYLSEGEDIEGLTLCDSPNTAIRSSNSASAYAAEENVEFTKIPAGTYKLTAVIYDSAKNPDSYWSFLAGETEIANFHCTTVNYQEFTSEEFVVTAETPLYIGKGGKNTQGVDLVYVVRTGDAPAVEEPAETTTVTYALEVGETHKAGETVEVKNGDEVVATLTFGYDGDDFAAGKELDDLKESGFGVYTAGNGVNPTPKENPTTGTVYVINPKYDGIVEVGIYVASAGKNFYVLEDGTALADYNGITKDEKYSAVYAFDVKAGSEYKVYASGSKLGFYGFNYTFAAEGGDEVQYETVDLTADMFHEWDGFGADANVVSETTYMEYNVGKELGESATVYGNGSVLGSAYADLTGAVKLVFEGTPGVVARALFNRQSMDGSSSDFVQKLETISEEGKAEMDLTDLPYAHLNVIKLGFGSPSGTISAIKVVKPATSAPGLTLPITEDFEGETSIFEGGELFDAADLGHVLLVKNTTATADLAGYTPAEGEKVTVKFTAYQGWVSGGTFVVALKNTEEKDLVSYTYDCGPCNVTDVAIGGTTVEGFEAFFGQSNSTNAASKGSANIFGHASQPFVATEGYNPQVTMSVTGTGLVEFNFQYMAYNSTEINVTYSEQLPEGTKIDLCCLVLTATGNANSFGIDNLSITSAEAGEQPGDENVRRWDFTNWSEKTVANLIADAAQGTDEGWSDDEKNDGSNMDATAGNCFWAITTPNENGELLANGEVIEELKGLVFGTNVNNRGLAIAVNYPEALSQYHGPAYLWLGGANKQFFTIPAVAGGSYITMGIESHKASDARGIQLLVGGEKLGDAFTPTVYAENTWTVPEGETVDVVVDNTNGCHIYFIEVSDKAPETTGITETVKTQPQFEDGAIYNLQGQKVLKAQKGLYIINGKKVLVK